MHFHSFQITSSHIFDYPNASYYPSSSSYELTSLLQAETCRNSLLGMPAQETEGARLDFFPYHWLTTQFSSVTEEDRAIIVSHGKQTKSVHMETLRTPTQRWLFILDHVIRMAHVSTRLLTYCGYRMQLPEGGSSAVPPSSIQMHDNEVVFLSSPSGIIDQIGYPAAHDNLFMGLQKVISYSPWSIPYNKSC